MTQEESDNHCRQCVEKVSNLIVDAIGAGGAGAAVSTIALLSVMIQIVPNDELRSEFARISQNYHFITEPGSGVYH